MRTPNKTKSKKPFNLGVCMCVYLHLHSVNVGVCVCVCIARCWFVLISRLSTWDSMGPHWDSGLKRTPWQQLRQPLQPDPIVENAFDPPLQQPGTPIGWHELPLPADLPAAVVGAVVVVAVAFQANAMDAVLAARGNLS